MALLQLPPKPPIDRFDDKFERAFVVLAVFARLGFRRAPARLILERLSFVGALIELFQSIPALHRDYDWGDWVPICWPSSPLPPCTISSVLAAQSGVDARGPQLPLLCGRPVLLRPILTVAGA